MDAYHDQRRFPGSGEAPPPPHASHANTQWYPGPPPPYPPHPSHPYPPQHHQWGPPPAVQHQHHPPQQPYAYQPPPQQQPYAYQPPPPAPGNPWPPHHAAGQPPPRSYPPPPPGQAWTNHSWAPNPGYPGHGNEEDWATKAKAWAATKSVTENHQMQQHAISTSRNENHNYGFPDHYQQPAGLPTEVTEPLQPPVPQSNRGSFASPAKNFGSFPSTYEQEVSYNYSSASGNGNAMLQYPSSQAQSFPSVAPVQDGFPQAPLRMPVVPSMEQPPFGHERPTVDPSDQPLEFNSRKVPDMAIHTTVASNHDTVVASNHSWMPSATLGLHSRPPVPPQGAHMDPSVHATPHFGAISGANYVPPASFGVGTVTDVFPTDPNTPFNAAEKSKKDEIEAARTAAINQEIKRVLTEVLLKVAFYFTYVTDDLFNEIATKVLNEDDSAAEFNEPAGAAALKEPGESKTKTSAKVVLPAKPSNITSSDHRDSSGLSSGKGALLGLANYNSDDDDESGDSDDKPVSNLSSETNTGTANPEKYSSPGSTSFGEDVKSVGIKTQRRTNAELKHEHNHDTQNGEIPSDAKTFVQPKDIHKMDEKMHRRLDKISKDLVKEVKVDHTKELESSVGEKYNYGGKYSMYDKKGSIKESKGSDRIAKHESDTKDPQSRVNSKRDDAMGDRKDIPKDTRERNRDTDRRGSKGKDEKEERSRQMAKSSTSLSSRRSRSRSPRGRSRSRKESFSHGRGSLSSDEPSDNKRCHYSQEEAVEIENSSQKKIEDMGQKWGHCALLGCYPVHLLLPWSNGRLSQL
ncbi:hypothetical protein PR202_ga18714 [Eleusine coracana subsp. coracana]|uniref:Uncharacterized protein n=1 Tax=Eleusine coracana subsp. coracana TaxID=191504 RepID=A0AAV5CU30_ELECO|nr:hypothetical protein PR202_ga18714 [Eleusine coracana subsp. coracana]